MLDKLWTDTYIEIQSYLPIHRVEGCHSVADHAQAVRHADLLIPAPEVVRALVCSVKGSRLRLQHFSGRLWQHLPADSPDQLTCHPADRFVGHIRRARDCIGAALQTGAELRRWARQVDAALDETITVDPLPKQADFEVNCTSAAGDSQHITGVSGVASFSLLYTSGACSERANSRNPSWSGGGWSPL